jgi:hypothetical protein
MTPRDPGDGHDTLLDAISFAGSPRAGRLLDAIGTDVLHLLQRDDAAMRRGSHAHRCTCPCGCQESVECFVLPHRTEDGPYCPSEALTFTCAACAAVDVCDSCGAHPHAGESFVAADGEMLCAMCVDTTEAPVEDDAATVTATESDPGHLPVAEAPTHVLTLRRGMPAGYAECLRCARTLHLAEISEPCAGDAQVRSHSDGASTATAETATFTPRYV